MNEKPKHATTAERLGKLEVGLEKTADDLGKKLARFKVEINNELFDKDKKFSGDVSTLSEHFSTLSAGLSDVQKKEAMLSKDMKEIMESGNGVSTTIEMREHNVTGLITLIVGGITLCCVLLGLLTKK